MWSRLCARCKQPLFKKTGEVKICSCGWVWIEWKINWDMYATMWFLVVGIVMS
jgi:hypothetical protein